MKIIVFDISKGNALGQIRSFGEIGYYPILIMVKDTCYNYVADSKYVKEAYNVNSISDGISLIKKLILEDLSLEEKIFISTGNDGIIAALNESLISDDRVLFFNSKHINGLSKFMDKQLLCELAEQYGLLIPKSEVVEVGSLPQNIKYPIFTKPLDSFDFHGWKDKEKICRNQNELIEMFFDSNLKGRILLQEYIEKEDEYVLQGVSINGGKDVYLPIEGGYYRLPDDAYGTYMFFQKFNGNKILYNSIKNILKEIQYSGIFEVEFLMEKNTKKLYFLEINFRHTFINHCFTAMGCNLCKVWMDSVLKGKLCIEDVCINKEPFIWMNEPEDFKRVVMPSKLKLFSWIKDVLKTDSFVLWNTKDNKPFWNYLRHIIFR